VAIIAPAREVAMGLAEALGYEIVPPNTAQYAVQRVAATRPGGWILAKIQPPLDKVLFERTAGTTQDSGDSPSTRPVHPIMLAATPNPVFCRRGTSPSRHRLFAEKCM
jgi:hypothetical protein